MGDRDQNDRVYQSARMGCIPSVKMIIEQDQKGKEKVLGAEGEDVFPIQSMNTVWPG